MLENVWEKVLTILILAFFGIWVYSKSKHQTINDTIKDMVEGIGDKGGRRTK